MIAIKRAPPPPAPWPEVTPRLARGRWEKGAGVLLGQNDDVCKGYVSCLPSGCQGCVSKATLSSQKSLTGPLKSRITG